MPELLEKPNWLKALATGREIGVDREKNRIMGYVVAQEGPFKTEGRGEFDGKALRAIVKMMNEKPGGTKSRFTHPSLSADGLGSFLGRAHNARRDKMMQQQGGGMHKEIEIVRADLHLDPTSFETPNGNLGKYVMDLAESDPEAFSTSLVLKADEEYRLAKDGTLAKDENGNPLPPLWRPTAIHASDIVDTGEAVDGFLSAGLTADGMPDEVVRLGSQLLKKQFAGQSRKVMKARCLAWLDRIAAMWPDEDEDDDDELLRQQDATLRLKLELKAKGVI